MTRGGGNKVGIVGLGRGGMRRRQQWERKSKKMVEQAVHGFIIYLSCLESCIMLSCTSVCNNH